MKTRAITALFFVIVVLACMLFGGYVFAVFAIVLCAFCLGEFYRIVADETSQPNRFLGLVAAVCPFGLYAAYRLGAVQAEALWIGVPLFAALFIVPLYQKQEKPFSGIALTLLGVVYVALPFVAFFSLGFLTAAAYDYRIPLGFMLILWGNDTGAYLVGRFLGRNRLFERISPKKTWEGLAGGIVLAIITSLVLAHYFPVLVAWRWASVALIISLFGTYGDLVESMLKRSQQVKDSGVLLPGHGGLLDRFDGLLLAAPAVWAFLEISG